MKMGWTIKKLEEVVEFRRGLTYSKSDEASHSKNIVLRSNNVDLDTNSLNLSDLKYISDSIAIPENKKVVKGSLLICTANGSKNHLGKIAMIDANYGFAFGGFMGQVTPSNCIDSSYLFHVMTSPLYKKYISELSDGANINNLKFSDLGKYEIPVPPLPEQKRIVAILDEAFCAIAKAKANAEQNLKNAKELFESYLQSVFENKGDDWEEKTLGEIATVIGGYSFKSGDFLKEGKYQVIRMGNVRPNTIREFESPVYIESLEPSVLKRAQLLINDVIITQTGTKGKRDYGYTAIIEKENFLLNQRISAIRFNSDYLPRFFLYFSWTNRFKDQYFENEKGTVGQGNVGIGAITGAVVPYISLSAQTLVVQRLDALSIESQRLESIYQQKLTDLDELKKIILQKAFNGELNLDRVAV